MTDKERIANSELSWSFAENTGTLTISGSGKMPDFNEGIEKGELYFARIPWNPIADKIKAVVTERGVTSVSAGAFHGCENLKTAILMSVMQVSAGAFYRCKNIESAIMPEVITIGNGAFSSCDKLARISASESSSSKNISSVLFMDDFAFADCPRLEKLIFSNLRAVGEGAFKDCSSLKSLSAEKLLTIQRFAFYGCTSLIELRVRAGCIVGDKAFYKAQIEAPSKYVERNSGREDDR